MQAATRNILTELADALIHFGRIFRLINIAKEILAVLFQAYLLVAKEELAGSLRLTEKVVDIDADEDTNLLHIVQFFAQYEVSAGTKIANHGMEDVEVGHCRGDAVELVLQRRLDIVEKLGTHKAWRLSRFAFQSITKKLSVRSFFVYVEALDCL